MRYRLALVPTELWQKGRFVEIVAPAGKLYYAYLDALKTGGRNALGLITFV